MKVKIEETIELPSGVTATFAKRIITIKGPKGEATREIKDPKIKAVIKENKVTIEYKNAGKRQKRLINSFIAHINNCITGVQQPYQYKMKICSGHFPMNVSVSGDQLIVKNFLGEKSPRTLKLKKGATVKVEGDHINIESPDKDIAGQQASDIELLTSKSNRDLRVFQDGIYMIEKAGKKVSEA